MTAPPPALPPGHHLRRARPDDLAAVTALLAATDVAWFGAAETEEDETAEAWARPRFDLAADAWVVEDDDGAMVGYVDVWDEEPHVDFTVDSYVLPGSPRGIERTLLGIAEARAREHLASAPPGSAPVLHTIRAGTDDEGRALLAAIGWRHVRTFLRMGVDLPADPPAPTWPAGTAPRVFAPGRDEAALHEVLEAAFAGHFRHPAVPLEDFLVHLASPAFSPSLSFLVEDGGAPVAGALVLDEGDKVWLRQLGVVATARGRGMGLAMLRHLFGLARAAGRARVELGVDTENASNATRLYERAGMSAVRRYDFFARPLT